MSRDPILSRNHDRLCWHDIVSAVFAGLYPSDQHLETMLDHLERTP